jgi:hypothetical protein
VTPSTTDQKRMDAIFREIRSWRGKYDRIPAHVKEQVERTFNKLTDQHKMQITKLVDDTYLEGSFQKWFGHRQTFEQRHDESLVSTIRDLYPDAVITKIS